MLAGVERGANGLEGSNPNGPAARAALVVKVRASAGRKRRRRRAAEEVGPACRPSRLADQLAVTLLSAQTQAGRRRGASSGKSLAGSPARVRARPAARPGLVSAPMARLAAAKARLLAADRAPRRITPTRSLPLGRYAYKTNYDRDHQPAQNCAEISRVGAAVLPAASLSTDPL